MKKTTYALAVEDGRLICYRTHIDGDNVTMRRYLVRVNWDDSVHSVATWREDTTRGHGGAGLGNYHWVRGHWRTLDSESQLARAITRAVTRQLKLLKEGTFHVEWPEAA